MLSPYDEAITHDEKGVIHPSAIRMKKEQLTAPFYAGSDQAVGITSQLGLLVRIPEIVPTGLKCFLIIRLGHPEDVVIGAGPNDKQGHDAKRQTGSVHHQ
jgi:hypothetical protein